MTNAERKLIQSLHQKKYRQQEGLFLVEGAKSIEELLQSDFRIEGIWATDKFVFSQEITSSKNTFSIEIVSQNELERLSTLQSNESALAVVRQKDNQWLMTDNERFALALDDIRDPGNMGTIIRIADWYGIQHIVASPQSVELYNPKTIAATMGSFTRVNIFYTDLLPFFTQQKKPVLGAFLDGENIHNTSFGQSGFLLMGNESRGISESLEPVVTKRIHIPRFGAAESLNAAIATAIVCDNLNRNLNAGY
jgi:RNA methyltransferase, TrmH family